MAVLAATKRVEAALRAKEMYTQFEQRFSVYGGFKAYRDNADLLLPRSALEQMRSARNMQDIVFPVLNKQTLTIITANACTFTGQDPVSAKPSFTEVWRGFAIRVFPKVARNNYISETEQFANGLVNGIRSFLENVDTYSIAQLEANKSTSLATTNLVGTSIVANAYQLTQAKADKLYTYIPAIMERNDMGGRTLMNVMTTEGRARMLDFETHGQNNDQNLRGVLEGDLPSASNYRHYSSNRMTNGVGVEETHYLIPVGNIGVFSSIDSDALDRAKWGALEMYPESDPILGIEWGVKAEDICVDLTADYGAGYEAVHGTQYRYLAKFAFMNAYSSDATKPIVKLEVMS